MDFVVQAKHNNLIIDFYTQKRSEIYVTAEQLALGIGYKSANTIYKIIQRNPYLRDKKYSVLVDKLSTTSEENTMQEKRYFTKKGLLHICSMARTKQGKMFRDWIFDYILDLERKLFNAKIAHTESKDLQKMLHDAVFTSPMYGKCEECKKRNMVMNFNRLANKTASKGRTDKKEELYTHEIQTLQAIEHKIIVLLNEGNEYGAIKTAIS